jgi:hypothetical protein
VAGPGAAGQLTAAAAGQAVQPAAGKDLSALTVPECTVESPALPSEVEEPYHLDVRCRKNGKHYQYFCCCEIQLEVFPIPPPPRALHPALGIGLLSSEHSDRNSSCYDFVHNGEEHLIVLCIPVNSIVHILLSYLSNLKASFRDCDSIKTYY